MNSLIIGTAGHIDHGKTALIKALNGFEGDQNPNEKVRKITIDLSFSHLQNKNKNIAFIDVPGHENLVKTMISGAYAFDATLLVVASDDGIMPQTKEHLQILSILGVSRIVLCITKCDLTDTVRQKYVENEVRNFVKNFKNLTILKSFFISIKDLSGVSGLREFLFTIEPIKRVDSEILHYYIDRVFSLKGFGTIVTGSLISGILRKNEKIYNCDLDKSFIVKNLQIHDENVEIASSPNRVAINLDAKTSELEKGQIFSKKGFFRGFNECDCVFYGEISHKQNVIFCVGSRQIAATALILSENGNEKFITFKFEKEIFVKFNEHFVVLASSRVIGGGDILNPVTEPLKKSQKIALLCELKDKNFIKVFEILSSSHKHGFGLISSFQRFDMTHENALKIARNLKNAITDESSLCIYDKSAAVGDLKDFINFIVSKNDRAVISAQSLALKISWASPFLCDLTLNELIKDKILQKNGNLFIKFGADFDEITQSLENKIFEILSCGGIAPIAPYNIYDELEIDRTCGDNAMKKLTKAGKIVRITHNVFLTDQNLQKLIKKMRSIIASRGFVNVSVLKDELGISRKFLIAYLEYLDLFDDIKKDGNNRIFK
ncbi:selenocysteine-specific translation elongation factor [Campylobacter hominis]|uniref:Selenocysteine-specific translation elongation factor n=1 Tax=Campylobacter hominis (strain ATCC BAA-381 / DSM 21671 / CCUG 45161 / LMG 19568 / NCTC 13146 / CH001A) TaxID=360107 RepID=A7I1E9_CAMHC|nr:selenocysteine-specific translation elongation factor [Campylobacter hominis]ABS51903.1 selenocysteine-specific translation elongation factor [Campylobacter hominis ATCC BAA-381]UAK86352.1 selenocysteine-specific translation elongation factor [Campylobacter hominis]SUW84882.1 selenocysteine-specific translation elongation factor [Campylobacter hominis]